MRLRSLGACLAPALLGACASLYGVTDVPTPDDASGDGGPSLEGGAMRDGTTGKGDARAPPDGGQDHRAPDAHEDGTADGRVADAATDAPAPPSSTLTVAPGSLAFGSAGGVKGNVACGSAPGPEAVTVTNAGSSPVTWWTALGLGASSPYVQSESACSVTAPCLLGGGASVTVTVTAPPVPSNAGITSYDDVLIVSSRVAGDAGAAAVSQSIPLHEVSYGAILAYSPTSASFGAQPTSGTYSTPIQIQNSGNAAVTGAAFGVTGSAEFTFSSPPPTTIPLTGSTFSVSFTPAGDTTAVVGTVGLTLPGLSTCAASPTGLALSGQGTSALVSVTSALNFNTGANGNGGVGISCGKMGPTLQAAVTNTGTASATITALTLGLGAGSAFAVSTASLPITVLAGSTAMIPVVPNPVAATSAPAVSLDDVLHVTVGGTAYNVALHETSAGAALSLATTSLTFSSTAVNQKATYGQVITNHGNLAAPVTFSASKTVFTFDGNLVAAASANTPANAYFEPTSATAYSATGSMVVASGTPICGGGTATTGLSLAGMGTFGNSYTVAPTSLAFGGYPCGSSPPSGQTVTVTNGPLALGPVGWTATLGGANPGLFTLSAASGSAGAFGGMSTFKVAPIALTSGSGLTKNEVLYGVSAILTVVVGTGAGAETFTLPVTEMPTGACGQ